MQDPCNNIESLDFYSDESFEKIILRDKHTRVEGMFTEYFFYEEILKDVFSDVSSSWWFRQRSGAYNIAKIIYEEDDLSSFDVKILNYLSNQKINVFIIIFNKKEKKFYYIKYKEEYSNKLSEALCEFKKEYPKNPKNAAIPKKNERNEKRILQAIGYLKSVGVLKNCAIERLFANCWLAEGAFWDIDFFVEYKGKLIAFEVKQKYPTKAGTFGINVGLANLFVYLNNIGMEVIHVILVKPVNDISIPAIDLYTKPQFKKDAKWIATRFTRDMLRNRKSTAPSYTSIFGTSRLDYYHMKPEIFTTIKEINSKDNRILSFLDNCF